MRSTSDAGARQERLSSSRRVRRSMKTPRPPASSMRRLTVSSSSARSFDQYPRMGVSSILGVTPRFRRPSQHSCFPWQCRIAAWSLPWPVRSPSYWSECSSPSIVAMQAPCGDPDLCVSKLDARAAFDYARNLLARRERAAIYGPHIGSAIGVELAAEVKQRRCSSRLPFTSARAMASRLGRKESCRLACDFARALRHTDSRCSSRRPCLSGPR